MAEETVEAAGDLGVPLGPCVGAGFGVELGVEVVFSHHGGKASDGVEERFVVARC